MRVCSCSSPRDNFIEPKGGTKLFADVSDTRFWEIRYSTGGTRKGGHRSR
jgi:hypothetical protein